MILLIVTEKIFYHHQNLFYKFLKLGKYLEIVLTSLMNCDSILACTLFDKLDGVSPEVDVEPLNLVVVGLLKVSLRSPGLSGLTWNMHFLMKHLTHTNYWVYKNNLFCPLMTGDLNFVAQKHM